MYDEYLYQLRLESLNEVYWADNWLRWYFLGPYSDISNRHKEWILERRRQP